MTTATATAITTSPGARIGADTDRLPARYQVPQDVIPAEALSTEQRIARTFVAHGIDSSLIVQLQHLQELALAIQLQGRHLIHLDLFGCRSGLMQLTIAGCPREGGWAAGVTRVPSYYIEIAPGGDEMPLREAQAKMSRAAADLMALLEEDAQ